MRMDYNLNLQLAKKIGSIPAQLNRSNIVSFDLHSSSESSSNSPSLGAIDF
jgi:hypothetical protein